MSANALARHYSRFDVAHRLLLTGHSHQAWPDVAFEAQQQAWLEAAELVDDKWERAFARAAAVRAGFARLLDDAAGNVALGVNTHELVVRFLSALPLRERPRLVTTDGEFHTLRRQLDRLAEAGLQVVHVASEPADTVADRLGEAVDDRTAAVLASVVFFHNGQIAVGLHHVLERCQRAGAELLLDAYHALNVVPFSLPAEQLGGAFVVGGGYKYCQLGEGNCFLRFPPGCVMRPVITGWFSEFATLTTEATDGAVVYGRGPDRFAGATYDPTSHYRAARVFAFFEEQGLTPQRLREVSQHQIALLARGFDALNLDPAVVRRDRSVPLKRIGGFLALHAPAAQEIVAALRKEGVYADARGHTLRLGPAPYLSDQQLEEALQRLGAVVNRQ